MSAPLATLSFDDQLPATPRAAQGRREVELIFAALQQQHPHVTCWPTIAALVDLAYMVARIEQQAVSYADFMECIRHRLSKEGE